MIDTGIYHPFLFVENKSDILQEIIVKASNIVCILTGDFTVGVYHFETDYIYNDYTAIQRTYEINGNTIKATILTINNISASDKLYIRLDTYNYGVVYSREIITGSSCDVSIESSHTCNNQYYNWGDYLTDKIVIKLNNYKELAPIVKKDSTVIVTDKGSLTDYRNHQLRHRCEIVAPTSFNQFLESTTINDIVKLSTSNGQKEIVNIEIEQQEQGDSYYSKFILSFVFKDSLQEQDACCIDINIDEIQGSENPGSSTCEGFSVEIINTNGLLSVNMTNPPTGTALYKWYRDNVYLSNAENIQIESSGNYSVNIIIAGCRATAAYFKDNVCRLFQIEVTNVLNDINATASNIPEGETVIWNVEKDGGSLSSILPYTATESGIYYVRATAGNCEQIKGIYINLEDDNCNFTISINENGNNLEAVTDAGSPTYSWELETSEGKEEIGTGATVTMSGKGIYWLTITNGGCSKSVYLYKEPSSDNIIFVNSKVSGNEFSVADINLLAITQPAIELEVYINDLKQIYLSSLPPTSGFYTITSLGKIQIFNSITNGTIKIVKK